MLLGLSLLTLPKPEADLDSLLRWRTVTSHSGLSSPRSEASNVYHHSTCGLRGSLSGCAGRTCAAGLTQRMYVCIQTFSLRVHSVRSSGVMHCRSELCCEADGIYIWVLKRACEVPSRILEQLLLFVNPGVATERHTLPFE
jgi:hypothetical protein